jgi:hypothetical protein
MKVYMIGKSFKNRIVEAESVAEAIGLWCEATGDPEPDHISQIGEGPVLCREPEIRGFKREGVTG